MNVKEWKSLEKHGDDWFWRNKAVKYFNLQKGQVIHHLRDTEEQRDFNDKHYERWGFDFNGEMKYCIVMTSEEHRIYHSNLRKGNILSDSLKKEISESTKKGMSTETVKKHISEGQKRRYSNLEERKIQSNRVKSFMNDPIKKEQWKSTLPKNRKWYTNGFEDIQSNECPKGFYEGRSKLKNKPSPNRKRIKCVETGTIYDSVVSTGVKHSGSVANGDRLKAGGYTWVWVD